MPGTSFDVGNTVISRTEKCLNSHGAILNS